ncbi:SPOR domain-containing protein [Sphingomonas sp. MMS24-J45]|uniref:SPOR domain-containing protein n=1 Tax=Sphingomonas sp. MMS24-J45 TaxID=3238806 RepID=UPI00384C8E1E
MAILIGLLLASGGVGVEAAAATQRGTAGDRAAMKPELWSGPATAQIQRPSDLPPELADTRGPRGTSGEAHDDGVGYAMMMAEPPEARWSNVAVGVGYAGLAPGALVELTALDTGRTIVALVVGRETSGGLVALTPGAAQALGVAERAPVRVRSVITSPQDEMALRSGQAASPRLDAPPALLTALRRKLPGRIAPQRATTPPRAPTRSTTRASAPAPAAAPAQRLTGGYYVQVAALSSSARATALARDLGGRVAASGGLYRVQLGPFTTSAEATRARDGAARRGYGDARILHSE